MLLFIVFLSFAAVIYGSLLGGLWAIIKGIVLMFFGITVVAQVLNEPSYLFLPVVILVVAYMLYGICLAFKWLVLLLWRYKKYLLPLPVLGLFATNELVHLLALFYTSFWVMLGLVWICYHSLRFVWMKLTV